MSIPWKIAPHAAVLLANMYYVFYGIDRVNKAMNFIDNGLTKTVLLVMCLSSAMNLLRMQRVRRKRTAAPVSAALWMAHALLMAFYLVVFFISLSASSMILLNEVVKLLTLLLCILSTVNGIRLMAADRAAIRSRMRRTPRPMPAGGGSAPAIRSSANSRRPTPYTPNRYGASAVRTGYSRPTGRSTSAYESSNGIQPSISRRKTRWEE